MKDCRDVEPLKAPYVDGDAEPAQRSAVDTHITACGRCRDEVTVERAARDVLVARRDELRAAAPAALRARCGAAASDAKQRPSTAAPASRPIYRRWMPMSVAATLVLVVAGVLGLGLNEQVQALAFQTTIDHVKCARFNAGTTPADPAVEGQRWTTRFGWPLRVAPSSDREELELRAVRRCAVTDGRVAHLMYRWRGEPLSVYVLPAETLPAAAQVERFGHDAVMWSRNGRTYVVLTRTPRRAGLDGVVQYVKANVY